MKECGFNSLWKSGVQMTDDMINGRIKKIYSKMIFNGFYCRCQCRCRPDVGGFVTLISFSAPMDDILSNEQWKDSLQFLQILPIVSTKSLA